MKQKPVVRYGWIGKDDKLKNVIYKDEWGEYFIFDIIPTKGYKLDWVEKEWPPRKVKITVELVEK